RSQYASTLHLIDLDVSDPSSIAASFESVRQQTDSLDVLINNAGISGGTEPLGTVTQETLLQNYKVNAAGPILMAQQYLDLLRAGKAKKIINLTTGISSISNRDWGGMYSYTASKAALNMLNKNLSLDVAKYGISTIVIDPGWVKTDMGGPNAWITPEESVTGILRVMDNLTLDQSGKFFHYSGSEIPW
ncbi:MAG TPA: SDR family oxidoreductase, partial [Aggregatilineaceae bacterium]|nr:SDR family oxidoreductase [Aggregatilineaceae bacterium]